MTSVPGPIVIGSFVFEHPQTKTLHNYYESEHGVACNFSLGDEDKYSVRLAGQGAHETGLSEVDALLMLARVLVPGVVADSEEEDAATDDVQVADAIAEDVEADAAEDARQAACGELAIGDQGSANEPMLAMAAA